MRKPWRLSEAPEQEKVGAFPPRKNFLRTWASESKRSIRRDTLSKSLVVKPKSRPWIPAFAGMTIGELQRVVTPANAGIQRLFKK
jgi:hypothetical protein